MYYVPGTRNRWCCSWRGSKARKNAGKHGITCNAVAPGMILTDMTRHHWEKPENAELIKKRVPMGRIGRPEDIGKVCVFLASDDAEYISGITLRVDGGHQACCA